MTQRTPDPFSDDDTTFAMLRTLDDGSVAGVVNFHRWKMQLLSLRALPETEPVRGGPSG
jgi:hypothetical protein